MSRRPKLAFDQEYPNIEDELKRNSHLFAYGQFLAIGLSHFDHEACGVNVETAQPKMEEAIKGVRSLFGMSEDEVMLLALDALNTACVSKTVDPEFLYD